MTGSTFKTNPVSLKELLRDAEKGVLQLPDFQRSWVWDENRLKSLAASISRAFPIGAVMTLATGGETNFKPRPIEGAPSKAKDRAPDYLLLDGQQRITSLYQMTLRNEVVETITPRQKKVKRWFYIDVMKALDDQADREESIIGVPEDKIEKRNFDREIVLDLSTREKEFELLFYPLSMVFRWDDWQMAFTQHYMGKPEFEKKWEIIKQFKERVIDNFTNYNVPVIALDKSTSKEAVCVVFEKVNTGGKPLDAFELVTAMYAAEGHELRKDWLGEANGTEGRKERLGAHLRVGNEKKGILEEVASTDFLQVISLFHTRDLRRAAANAGKQGKELTQITGNRQALLNLPLEAYLKFESQTEEGFKKAAKFLHQLNIFRVKDLPYQSQITVLAAILAELGDEWEHTEKRAKLVRWYWCGVFGELYGSAVDTRIAKDFVEVVEWLRGGDEPTTVRDAVFRSERLETMRMRLSAAYKGVNALLMSVGAKDWISGQAFSHTNFFDENTDIHHIFPQDWCKKQNPRIDSKVYDSIINKTPLSARTNRIIGGNAPSEYLAALEKGSEKRAPIDGILLNELLATHLIDPVLLRSDDFAGFMKDRQKNLLGLIEEAMGMKASDEIEEGEDASTTWEENAA